MKKIITHIILIFSLFSILSYDTTFCSEWLISDMLNIEDWAQESQLNTIKIKTYSLKNEEYRASYAKMKSINQTIKNQILKRIQNNELTYYTWVDTIRAYSNFINSVNRMFELYSQKETYPSDSLIDSKIIDNYYILRTNYKKLQYLINK